MKTIYWACLVAIAAVPTIAQAERFDATAIGKQFTAKNYAALMTMVDADCDRPSDLARKNKVADRAEDARASLQCVNEWRGRLMALAPDADTRIRVRELIQPMIDIKAEVKKEADAQATFMGFNWGLGFGYSFGSDEAVDGAEIVNGVVRVTSRQKEQPRVVFEFHKYFWCNKDGDREVGTRGCGPFVSVAAKDDKLLSGVGIGFMYGQKTKVGDSDGFSVGLGLILDSKVKDLGEGFRENEAPPAGETTVRFEEKSRWSVLLFVTRTF